MNTASPASLRYLIEGRSDGPVLVLSGSLGTTLELWDKQVPALTERFRVLRYDHRGHGGSSVPSGPYRVSDMACDLLALLDRLDLGRVALCGLSMGAMVAMWLATHAPERIDRLILCSTSARLGSPRTWERRAQIARVHGTGALCDAVVRRWFTDDFRSRYPQEVATVEDMLRQTPAEGYAACCEAIACFDIRDLLASISAPTLVLAGADDPSTPPEHAAAIHAAVAASRLVVLPSAAHLPNVEQPAAFCRCVLDHICEPATREAGL